MKPTPTTILAVVAFAMFGLLAASLPKPINAQNTRPVSQASPQSPSSTPRQTQETLTISPSNRTYRNLREPEDVKAANAQLEAYKKKVQAELKVGRTKYLEASPKGPLSPLNVISLTANGSTTLSTL